MPAFAMSPNTPYAGNDSANFFAQGAPGGTPIQGTGSFPVGFVNSTGERFWTIQRVNGNGGNGKADGVGGPHRHTLEESDRIKKSSVQRFLASQDGSRKKAVSSSSREYS